MEIRKAALIAGIAGTLGLVMPGWYTIRQIATEFGSRYLQWASILSAATLLFSLTVPAFCIALYRNEGTLQFPTRFRSLSLTAALAYALIVAVGLPRLIGSLGPGERATVLSTDQEPWIMGDVSTLVGLLSNLAWIGLLIAFFRASGGEDGDLFASKGLRLASKVASIAWGIWLVFNVLRLVLTPYTYFQIRDYAAQIQRTPPEIMDMLADVLLTLLSSACLLTAPLIVWMSSSAGRGAAAAEPAEVVE